MVLISFWMCLSNMLTLCVRMLHSFFFFFSFFSKHLCIRFDFDSFLLFLCEMIFVFLNILKEAGFKIAFLTSQAPSFGVSLYSHLLFCELLSLSPSCFYLDLLTPPPLSGCYLNFCSTPIGFSSVEDPVLEGALGWCISKARSLQPLYLFMMDYYTLGSHYW